MIDKITRIQPLNPIPQDHLRWCGIPTPKKKTPEKNHELSFGELVLYDKFGKKQIYILEPESDK